MAKKCVQWICGGLRVLQSFLVVERIETLASVASHPALKQSERRDNIKQKDVFLWAQILQIIVLAFWQVLFLELP
jgi:hypothetical protein